jgi:hypothetical protein
MLVLSCRQRCPDRGKKSQTLLDCFFVKSEMPEARQSGGLELFDFPTAVKMPKNTNIFVRQP